MPRARQILQVVADLASVEGLEGLTIGRLATALNMSKSGLFAHFGSKEELQLATIDAARRRFVDRVVRPSRGLPRGRARLEAMLDDWLAYYRDEAFPGGCFFHNIKAEFDSRPDNAVREVVAEDVRQFIGFLEREIRKAQEAADPRPQGRSCATRVRARRARLVADQHFQILRDRSVFERAATAIRARLDLVDAK